MGGKAIARVCFFQRHQFRVPLHLGKNRGGRDRRHPVITLDHGLRWIGPAGQAIAIYQDIIRLWQERSQSDDLLWTGTAFQEFELWRERFEGALTETERAFAEAMEARVKAWVFERGGRLMYLGGNGINCEVEFLDEKTMRCK